MSIHLDLGFMKTPLQSNADHPLVGTWVDYWFIYEFIVVTRDQGFTIRICNQSDPDELVISQEAWDGEWFTFESLCEETGRVLHQRWRMLSNGNVESCP